MINPPGLEVQEQAGKDGSRTLVLSGELDIAAAAGLQHTNTRLCAADGTRALTLDLSRIVFIDSSGLAAVVYASRLCERRGYDFAVIPGPQAVHRVFELTGLAEVMPFRTGTADAAGP
jgi:anti-sigma B factor antagonist